MTRENLAATVDERSGAGVFGDTQMELIMGRLLRVGVLLAATLVAAGGAIYLWGREGAVADYRKFTSIPIGLRHVPQIIGAAAHGNAVAILELGVLLLVATPVCRVIFAVVGFSVERDWLYVAISGCVLGVLLFGLLRGV